MSTVVNYGGAGPKLHFAHANGYPPAAYLPLIERLTPHYHVLSQPARPLWPGHAPGEVSGWQPFVDDLLQERSMDYSPSELMTVNAARLLRDGDVVFVGVGLPNLACNLARRTHAPRLTMIYEAGVIGAQPARLPLSIGDPTLVSGAAGVCSMYEIFAFYLQRGLIDVGFLGGAQIDRFGNVNATVIGSYEHPKVRLPGSGGSAEIAAWAQRTYLLTPHQKRRFPARCDFITGAGYLGGRAERQARGLHGGPQAVVTDLGLLEPDESGELRLTALHPGKTLDEARANTGWDLQAAPHLRVTEPPSADELRLLRDELDPEGIYLKAGA